MATPKPHLSALVEQVEVRDSIDITRRGKPIARLAVIAVPRKRIDKPSANR